MSRFVKISVLLLFLSFSVPFLVIPFSTAKPTAPSALLPSSKASEPAPSVVSLPSTIPDASPSSSSPPVAQEEPSSPPVAMPTIAGAEDDIIEYYDLSEGRIKTVSRFDYVRGAIAAEMPPTFHPEALAAQGICAHTRLFYLENIANTNPDPSLEGAVFSADPSKNLGFVTEDNARELYGANFSVYWNIITSAAEYATERIIIYENQPILAAYHAMSNSMTESSGNVWEQSLPYLVPVESEGDALAESFTVKKEITRAEFIEKLTDYDSSITLDQGDEKKWVEILEYSDSDYILSLEVGDTVLSGREFREILGLRSTCFDVDYQYEVFTFTTEGYGHGVGFSQNGADFMARQDSSTDEILNHYFTNCKIVTAGQITA